MNDWAEKSDADLKDAAVRFAYSLLDKGYILPNQVEEATEANFNVLKDRRDDEIRRIKEETERTEGGNIVIR